MEEIAKKIVVDRGYVLAAYLEVDRSDLDDGYRENIFEMGSQEYLILTDEEADEAAEEDIKNSLCYFSADFLEAWTNLGAEAIRAIQGGMYERANDPLKRLIGNDWKDFVKDAVSSDGRGHFLSPYDREENEVRTDDADIRQAITKMLREEEELEEGAADPVWVYDFTTEEEDATGIWLYIYRLN